MEKNERLMNYVYSGLISGFVSVVASHSGDEISSALYGVCLGLVVHGIIDALNSKRSI